MKSSRGHDESLRVLDALRGLAALYVVLHHATRVLWSPSTDVGLFVQSVFSFGQQAVLLFFLISGFCIHYRQAQTGASRIDLRRFAWRRLRRLYPPLLLALAVTAACDWFGTHINPAAYVETTAYGSVDAWIATAHAPTTLLGNVMFQARVLVPEFGSDAPLWSLSLEFWFYALYPLALLLFRRVGVHRVLLIAGVLGASTQLGLDVLTAAWNPSQVLVWILRIPLEWPVWLMGAGIAEAYARGTAWAPLRKLGPASIVCLVGMAVLSKTASSMLGFSDLVWGVFAAATLAYTMLERDLAALRVPHLARAVALRLGDVSYSLYLLHYPLLLAIAAWWTSSGAGLPLGPQLAVAGALAALALGWLGWWSVERHCVTPRRSAVKPVPVGERTFPTAAYSPS